MKTRIGHLLTRDNLVSEAQLTRALEVQSFAGGRIGTLLLEGGALGEDDLGKTLALQHGCGYIPWRVLADISAEALAALPTRFALKHNAIPYERGEGYVKMVLRDPSDLRVFDELVFVTGRKVFAGVAPEVRIYQALEKYYGKLRAPRFALLAEKLARSKRMSPTRPAGPPPAPDFFAETPESGKPMFTSPPVDSPALSLAPPPAPRRPSPTPVSRPRPTPSVSERPSPSSWFDLLPRPAPGPERGTPAAPETIAWDDTTGGRSRRIPAPAEDLPPFEEVAAFEQAAFELLPEPQPEPPMDASEQEFPAVADAAGRDAIADAVLDALGSRFRPAAIFSSRSDGVAGWVAAGEHIDPFAVRSFTVSWTEPSIFLNARLSRTFYLGPLPALPRHDQLAAALGGWPGECVVQPVFIGERPVAFLLVTAPRPGTVTAHDLAYLRDLSEAASSAFANAIRLRKREI